MIAESDANTIKTRMREMAYYLLRDGRYSVQSIAELFTDAANEIERLQNALGAERPIGDAGFVVDSQRAEIEQLHLRIAAIEAALYTVAMPKRPDGTYNNGREACEQIARNALRVANGCL